MCRSRHLRRQRDLTRVPSRHIAASIPCGRGAGMECDRRTAASLRTSHSPPEKERIVKRTIRLSTMLATGLLTAVVASASAQEFATRLSGYQETPLTINSNGSGGFTAKMVPRSDTVKCSTDPSTTLLLLSPRSRGLVWIRMIEPDDHLECGGQRVFSRTGHGSRACQWV